tara:strand:+ start:91 stop:531 length:441 start_codon:yes stop_codon:yes gene_type:complete
MIKAIIRAIYSSFISIILISIVLTGWTFYAFISQPTKSSEIINVTQEMYENQKSVIIDIVALSKILIKDTSEKVAYQNKNILVTQENQTDPQDKTQLDESSIVNGNGDNPLGIVIEPSLDDLKKEPLVYENSELSNDEMELEMEMD